MDSCAPKEKYAFYEVIKKKAWEYASISEEEWTIIRDLKEKRNSFVHKSLDEIEREMHLLRDKNNANEKEIAAFEKCLNFCLAEQK